MKPPIYLSVSVSVCVCVCKCAPACLPGMHLHLVVYVWIRTMQKHRNHGEEEWLAEVEVAASLEGQPVKAA